MITTEIYEKILNDGLCLDHYMILCNARDNKPNLKHKRMSGFTNLLIKKGYLKDGRVTKEGMAIISVPVVSTKSEKFDFPTWVNSIHKKCQEKLLSCTGKKQVRARIERKAYSFLPNPADLGKSLSKVIKLYNINNLEKLEETLLRYIDSCSSTNNWFPLLNYYIIKNNTSQLVTDMDDVDEVVDQRSTQKFV